MHDVINSVLTAVHNLLTLMRSVTIAEWGGSSVTLFSAAVSLLIFEKIISCFFAVISRFTGGSDDD